MRKEDHAGNPDSQIVVPKTRVDTYVSTLPAFTQSVVRSLVDSGDFRFAQDATARHIKTADGVVDRNFTADLSGFLFGALAYQYLKRTLPPPYTVLTPRETFEVYYLLHPERRRIIDPSGLHQGVESSYVPNGLIIGSHKGKGRYGREHRRDYLQIAGVAEYMLNPNHQGRQRKIRSTQEWLKRDVARVIDKDTALRDTIGEYLKPRYPHFPRVPLTARGADYIERHVLPSDVRMPTFPQEKNARHAPVRRREFDQLVSFFLIDVRDGLRAA